MGVRIRTPIECRELLGAIAEVAGAASGIDTHDDQFLSTFQAGSEPSPRTVFSEFTLNPGVLRTQVRLVLARRGALKLIVNVDGADRPCLFDLERDPNESRNLYELPAWPWHANPGAVTGC